MSKLSNIRLYITLAHICSPGSSDASLWRTVLGRRGSPVKRPGSGLEARPIARFFVTNWLGALGRSLPEGYNYGFDCRETATSCAVFTGSNPKTRQTRSTPFWPDIWFEKVSPNRRHVSHILRA